MEAIFSEFDTENSGRVDLSQVASGISILCAVPMSDKVVNHQASFPTFFSFNYDFPTTFSD